MHVPTKKGVDGGRDAEIEITSSIGTLRAWVECKHHRRPLGLETLGKYLVLIINRRIHHLYIVSSSEITDRARIEMSRAAERQGLSPHYLDAANFETALRRYPDILQRYFPGRKALAPSNDDTPPLTVAVHVSEFYEASMQEPLKPDEQFLRAPHFFLHLEIANRTLQPVKLAVSPPAPPSGVALSIDPTSELPDSLEPLQTTVVTFCGRITTLRSAIAIESFTIAIEGGSTLRAPVPHLNLTRMESTPLIGAGAARVLAMFEERIIPGLAQHQAFVVDLRGGSGVGKSRLLQEVSARMRERDTVPLHFDAGARRDGVLRQMITELANVPMYRGTMRPAEADLAELLRERGAHAELVADVTSFVLGRVELRAVYYAVAETLRNLLRQPAIRRPIAVLLDNVQELSPAAVELLMELSEGLTGIEARTCLVLATNTDVVPDAMVERIAALHDRLRYLASSHRDVIRVDVEELAPDEAKRLLAALIHGVLPEQLDDVEVKAEEEFLQLLVEKVGARPFDLTMAVQYMREKEVIARDLHGRWRVDDMKRFATFIRHVPTATDVLIRRRIMAIRASVRRARWKEIIEFFRVIVAFGGRIPIDYLGTRTRAVADTLLLRSLVRYDVSAEVQSIAAFHDNIYRVLIKWPQFAPTRATASRALRFLERNVDLTAAEWAIVRFRNAVRARRRTEEIISIGEETLKTTGDARHRLELLELGEALTRFVDARTDLQNADRSRYLTIRSRYADALMHGAELERAREEYEALATIVRSARLTSTSEEDFFYHRCVNVNLFTGHYRSALALLEARAMSPPADPTYHFLVYDRLSLTQLAFGSIDSAQRAIDTALSISAALPNGLWTSIGMSDAAQIDLHGRYDRPAMRAKLADAIDTYERFGERESWRDLETLFHRSLIALVDGAFAQVIDLMDEALHTTRHRHERLYELTSYDLKACSQFHLGDVDAARATLLRQRTAALLGLNSRCYRRSMANLGALSLFERRYDLAATDLTAAVESLLRSPQAQESACEYDLPLLAADLISRNIDGRTAAPPELRQLWRHPKLQALQRALRDGTRGQYEAATEAAPCSLFHPHGLPFQVGVL